MEKQNKFIQVPNNHQISPEKSNEVNKISDIEKLEFSLQQVKSLIEGKLNLLQKQMRQKDISDDESLFTIYFDQMASSNNLLKTQIDIIREVSSNNKGQTNLDNKQQNSSEENQQKQVQSINQINNSSSAMQNNDQNIERNQIKASDNFGEVYQVYDGQNETNLNQYLDFPQNQIFQQAQSIVQNYNPGFNQENIISEEQMYQEDDEYYDEEYDSLNEIYGDNIYNEDEYVNQYNYQQNNLQDNYIYQDQMNRNYNQYQGFPNHQSQNIHLNPLVNQNFQMSQYQQPIYSYQNQGFNNSYIINQDPQQRQNYYQGNNYERGMQLTQNYNDYETKNPAEKSRPKRNEFQIQERLRQYDKFEAQYKIPIPYIFKTPFYLEKSAHQRFHKHLSVNDYYAVAMMYEVLGTQQAVADLLDTSIPNVKKMLLLIKAQIELGQISPENFQKVLVIQ